MPFSQLGNRGRIRYPNTPLKIGRVSEKVLFQRQAGAGEHLHFRSPSRSRARADNDAVRANGYRHATGEARIERKKPRKQWRGWGIKILAFGAAASPSPAEESPAMKVTRSQRG